ncbi:J domain-containing protein [Thalassovita mediterranea]|nr:J domain-containing protein [Thalassovita mediterranea]
MTQRPTEYPVAWPGGIERTQRRTTAQFRSTLASARTNVLDSLRKFGDDTGHKVSDVILSSNVTGLSGKMPEDPGVAVWFVWEGEYRAIAVDRYTKVEWNLQAIHHVIEAERTKMRHGGLSIVRSTLQAYLALAAPGARHWRDVLGLSDGATADDVKNKRRELAAKHHPDRGGSPEQFAEINAAADRALKELS